jgi:DNA polymerase-3 subunit chi
VSSESTKTATCQVDFYVLTEAAVQPAEMACTLALTMLERDQRVYITTETETAGRQLDELLWQYPEGRFLPHALADSADAGKAMINIGTLSTLNPVDVVINLCPEAIPQPERFSRILEIVPFADENRETSRAKYRTYREDGLTPRTQETTK